VSTSPSIVKIAVTPFLKAAQGASHVSKPHSAAKSRASPPEARRRTLAYCDPNPKTDRGPYRRSGKEASQLIKPQCLGDAVLLFSINPPAAYATVASDNEKRTRTMSSSWRPRLTIGGLYAQKPKTSGFLHGSRCGCKYDLEISIRAY
jgi:hypothetical protein